MGKRHAGRQWLTVFAASVMIILLVSTAFGQEGETQGPKIGTVSIEAIDPATGLTPKGGINNVDFKLSWELCEAEESDAKIEWVSEEYQAYFWNTPTPMGDPETTENLPPDGADSSGLTNDLEYVFEGKEANQQCYFLVKGILKGEDGQDSMVVLSPVSMDIFPRPVIAATLWQDIVDWISEKGTRTLIIIAVIIFLFLVGLYWAWGCFQKQGNGVLFPAKSSSVEAIVEKIIGGPPDPGNPDHVQILKAVTRSLDGIDEYRSSKNGVELSELPAYRIIEGAVNTFMAPRSTTDEIQGTLENQMGIELKELRTDSKTDWIWNIGYVEPLVGLFGTVTGLALAFSAKVADRDSDMYAGIYEALYTTIAGLFTGIVLTLIYNACDHRFHRIEGAFQRLATDLATHLRK